jgi:hypothetical protein
VDEMTIWTIEKLVKHIAQHDCPAEIRAGKKGQELWVLDRWLNVTTGQPGEEWKRIAPSINAVRKFLGY